MNQVINLSPINNYLQTKYDINQVVSGLDKVLAEMFKGNTKMVDILDKDIPFPLSSDLKKLAQAHGINLENDGDADKFYGEVRKAIMELPILTITTGSPPTLELVRAISDWVIANIKGFVAIDIVVDRKLIAGAMISFKGKNRDYSVKKETLGVETIENSDVNIKTSGSYS